MNILQFLCVLAIVLVVYLFSAVVLIFNPFFYSEIGADSEIAKQVTGQFVDYLRSPSFDVPNIQPLTEKENSHLLDVKIIIFRLQTLLLFVLMTLLLLHKYITYRLLIVAGLMLFLLPLASLLPFDVLFTRFHYVFFPQGNWQFDPATTTLVNVYPEEFFQRFFFRIILFGWLTGVALAGLGYCKIQFPPPKRFKSC